MVDGYFTTIETSSSPYQWYAYRVRCRMCMVIIRTWSISKLCMGLPVTSHAVIMVINGSGCNLVVCGNGYVKFCLSSYKRFISQSLFFHLGWVNKKYSRFRCILRFFLEQKVPHYHLNESRRWASFDDVTTHHLVCYIMILKCSSHPSSLTLAVYGCLYPVNTSSTPTSPLKGTREAHRLIATK